jgi:hypothetical protein
MLERRGTTIRRFRPLFGNCLFAFDPRVLEGARSVSPVAQRVLVAVLALAAPPECADRVSQLRSTHVAFVRPIRARPPGLVFGVTCGFTSALRPGDALTLGSDHGPQYTGADCAELVDQ